MVISESDAIVKRACRTTTVAATQVRFVPSSETKIRDDRCPARGKHFAPRLPKRLRVRARGVEGGSPGCRAGQRGRSSLDDAEPPCGVVVLEITRRLREVGELVGVRVLDHVVIGRGRYVSFVDDGYW